MEIYNKLETTYIITSSIWMQINGRSISKTKADLSLVGTLLFNHMGPSTSPCYLQVLVLGHIWFLSPSAQCSVDLTFLVLANPNLVRGSSNSTSSRKSSLLHLPIILFLHSWVTFILDLDCLKLYWSLNTLTLYWHILQTIQITYILPSPDSLQTHGGQDLTALFSQHS